MRFGKFGGQRFPLFGMAETRRFRIIEHEHAEDKRESSNVGGRGSTPRVVSKHSFARFFHEPSFSSHIKSLYALPRPRFRRFLSAQRRWRMDGLGRNPCRNLACGPTRGATLSLNGGNKHRPSDVGKCHWLEAGPARRSTGGWLVLPHILFCRRCEMLSRILLLLSRALS